MLILPWICTRIFLVRFTRPETVHADPDDPRGQITSETTMESTMTTDDKCGKCCFFFPYCETCEQKHNEKINRMVHIRRREDDDIMVATHVLSSPLVANTHVAQRKDLAWHVSTQLCTSRKKIPRLD